VTDWTLDAAVRQAAINFVLDRDVFGFQSLREGTLISCPDIAWSPR